MKKVNILLAEDDPNLGQLLKNYLNAREYETTLVTDGAQAMTIFRKERFHICLLDVMMPDMDGFEVLETIREFSNVPVIMLTAKGEEDDRVRGLELGADDYVTKPFSPRELVSRVKAVLRRFDTTAGGVRGLLEIDDRLKIDFDRREVWVDGKLVKLRPTEYRLLFHLVQNAGWVVTHEQLLSKVWGYEYRDEPHYVRLYINYLRQKLEEDPANPKYILTERGVGYRFVDFRRNKPGEG
jgi:two-component system KDP operon response regulator KdpE